VDFFRAHQAVGTKIPTYFIESTAPDNVDDTSVTSSPLPSQLVPIDSDLAVRQIASALVAGAEPNLVVMVHGFNNPEQAVLKMYTGAAMAIDRDSAITNRRSGLVCVGYRWPSEQMFKPWGGSWSALPTLPTWLLYFGLAMVLLSFPLFYWASQTRQWWLDLFRYLWNPSGVHVITMFGWTVAGLVLMAVLLRAIVYFRDNFRASNFGIPDLIQVIRAIDAEIARQYAKQGVGEPPRNVQLSFIGHSMGGFVVTNTIRTLSDVFAAPAQALNSYGADAAPDAALDEPRTSEIGHVFRLKRFVLASPDIPAETLLSSRGNFLASALMRFEEAYLFSNEGDEVLRQISTLANYFVFPTKSRNHGFRLGNVEILSRNFGLLRVSANNFLRVLRIGNLTLQELYDAIEDAKAQRLQSVQPVLAEAPLPKVFTYFDCTDYVDQDGTGGKPRPLLTFAKWRKRRDPDAKLRWDQHLRLLLAYLLFHQRPNVHGGYFEGRLSQQLIYRFACLGYADTIQAYGSALAMGAECERTQIRALVSPRLQRIHPGAVPPPPLTPAVRRSRQQTVAPPVASTAGTVIPNLVGMPVVKARAAIAHGARPQFVLLEVVRASTDQEAGTIVSQTPQPGARVQQLTLIEVIVAA
jgi:PASTA domain